MGVAVIRPADVVGPERQRAGPRGGARASRPPRDPCQLRARQAGESRPDRRLDDAARDARAPVHVRARTHEVVADGRHDRVALARRRAGRCPSCSSRRRSRRSAAGRGCGKRFTSHSTRPHSDEAAPGSFRRGPARPSASTVVQIQNYALDLSRIPASREPGGPSDEQVSRRLCHAKIGQKLCVRETLHRT